jgi:molybdate transport system ATP-binding protein
MAGSAFDAVSEGEQRMVLLARALVKEPVLLVLDEPCQGLDADNRARVRQAVEAIGGRLETSMIYVTHRLDDLPDIITHVLMLEEGRVVRKTKVNGQVRWGGSSSLFDDEEE